MYKLKARADVPRADRVGPRRNPGPDFFERGGQIGAYLGERADRRRVRATEHYFRCKSCGGLIDVRDVEGSLPHPSQDKVQ
jgi:hypothetical protein